ncbi:hypothetical protein HAX54_033779 [Datura stramonium]|uniref:Uncharacterized protein n=1 Tax=Datura stramonium TaxID=4076 RepID=A0ABS8VCW5_DATST|nr:hypothetical protein [Datura stramonium]
MVVGCSPVGSGEERRGERRAAPVCMWSLERGRWAEAAGLVFRRWEKGEEEAGEGELEVMVRAVRGETERRSAEGGAAVGFSAMVRNRGRSSVGFGAVSTLAENYGGLVAGVKVERERGRRVRR